MEPFSAWQELQSVLLGLLQEDSAMPPKYSRPKPTRKKGAVTLKNARKAVKTVQKTKSSKTGQSRNRPA